MASRAIAWLRLIVRVGDDRPPPPPSVPNLGGGQLHSRSNSVLDSRVQGSGGHAGWVRGVAIGEVEGEPLVATASGDRTARLSDTQTVPPDVLQPGRHPSMQRRSPRTALLRLRSRSRRHCPWRDGNEAPPMRHRRGSPARTIAIRITRHASDTRSRQARSGRGGPRKPPRIRGRPERRPQTHPGQIADSGPPSWPHEVEKASVARRSKSRCGDPARVWSGPLAAVYCDARQPVAADAERRLESMRRPVRSLTPKRAASWSPVGRQPAASSCSATYAATSSRMGRRAALAAVD